MTAQTCKYHYNITATGPATPLGGSSPIINNDNSNCAAAAWMYSYVVTGYTSISLQLESGFNPSPSGVPNNFQAFPGTVLMGTNPSTITPGGVTSLVGIFQYIRLNVTATTGSGSIDVYLMGYATPPSITTSTGTTGTGGSTNALTVNGQSIPANATCLVTNGSAQFINSPTNCNELAYSATDFVNYAGTTGGNNGITNMLAYCKSSGLTTCKAYIPFGYTGTDTVPGYNLDFTVLNQPSSNIGTNTVIIDERSGARSYITGNWCALAVSNQCSAILDQSVAWQLGTTINMNYFVRQKNYTWLGHTNNYNNLLHQDISNFTPEPQFLYNYGSGQSIAHGSLNVHAGNGDTFDNSVSVFCKGGLTGAPTDEGCKKEDAVIAVLAIDWEAHPTVTGTALSSISFANPIQGAGTLGLDNELINKTTGVVTGTATAQTCGNDTSTTVPCTITVSGTPFTADTARGTIGTAIAVGTNTVTPTFSVGSASNFSTSGLACLSDGFETERIYPTLISGGAITFVNTRPHISTAIITTGSSTCGTDFGFDADNITASTYGTIPNGTNQFPTTPVNTVLRVAKVIGSPATNQITIAWQGKGSYRQLQDNSSCCIASNGNVVNGAFHLYPAATVLALNAGGTSSSLNSGISAGPVQVGPNNIVVNTSDTFDSPPGMGQQLADTQAIVSAIFPSFVTAPGGGMSVDYWGVMHASDSLLNLANHTPNSFYTNGYYTYPYGIKMTTGYTSYAFWLNEGSQGTFLFSCTLSCNSGFYPFMQITRQGGANEYVYQNQLTGALGFTVNNGGFTFWHKPDGIELPQVADSSVTTPSVGSVKVYYSTTQTCLAYWAYGASITCSGTGTGGSGTNATALQGNVLTAGTFSNAGQSFVYNGTSTVITQLNSLANGWGSTIVSPSTGTQQVNFTNNIRTNNTSTDTITTADCGGFVIESYAGTTAIGIPQANSGSGSIMGTGCKVDIISWTGNTSNLTTTTSNFYSIVGSNTSQTFTVAATHKQISSLSGNYYQTY